ncbi:MAG: hypothetical protein ACLPX7_18135 [Xanthobacteraceae bacterium]
MGEIDRKEDIPNLGTAIRAVLRAEACLPSLEELEIRPEILEAAGEIADASDVPGIETERLEFLVRIVVWADRRFGRDDRHVA